MEKKPIIILKIGSSTLTRGTNQISRGKIEDLARQLLVLKKSFRPIIVSSGAIATARQFVELASGSAIVEKQALAAIGQPVLMRIYQEVFSDFGLHSAQCLLNYRDFDNDQSRINTFNTIRVLLENEYIPIINENDTVATEEIKFGDNDKLAALTAVLTRASILVLASDVKGLYDADPKLSKNARLIREVDNPERVKDLAGDSMSAHGSGGMKSKLTAAEICYKKGIEMWIIDGGEEQFTVKALREEIPFTRFVAPKKIGKG
jgi:glutamate 5-kinase